MRLCINAGHAPQGRPDPGAVAADGTAEWLVCRRLAEAFAVRARAAGHAVTIVQDDSLAAVVAAAEAFRAERFIAIHANAARDISVQGAEVYVHPAAGAVTRGWASRVAAAAMVAGRSVRADRDGYREADFYVLRRTTMPALLVETGFLTNVAECAFLRSEEAARLWADVLTVSL